MKGYPVRLKHYRSLAIILALCLCMTGFSTFAIGEEVGSDQSPAASTEVAVAPTVWYRTHATGSGAWSSDAEGWRVYNAAQSDELAAQSDEQALAALDSLEIMLSSDEYSGGVEYRIIEQDGSVANDWVTDGVTAANDEGIYGIEARLTGDVAQTHDLWYRTRTITSGWLAWAHAGEASGSTQAPIVEMQVCVASHDAPLRSNDELATFEGEQPKEEAENPAAKGEEEGSAEQTDKAPAADASEAGLEAMASTPSIEYQAHVQTYGWQDWVKDGTMAGTTGESKRLEGIIAAIDGADGGIEYCTHVQTYGWQDWVSDGEMSGTTGESKRLEAVRFQLTGNVANDYDIWYRCHVQQFGWMDWACNGDLAGSEGYSYRMESIQLVLLPKGSDAPGATDVPFRKKIKAANPNILNGVDISGWQQGIDIYNTEGDFIIIKATEGVSTPGKPATRYNPWYMEWADQVLDSGRLLGFYHYANGGDAVEEADAFYDAIKDYRGVAIACLDWEGQGNKLFDTGMDVAWCKKFLDRLKSRYGGTPFLYTSKNYCNVYDWSSVAASYPLWGAQYADSNPLHGYQLDPWQSANPWGAWGAYPTIFQYSGSGVLELNGGMEYFDLNLFYGSRNDWNGYL